MEKKKLQCVDLTYSIAGRCLFDGFNCEAEAGELVWLRGSNGSGKSTLLKLIAGIIPPDSGQILWPSARHEIVYIGHKPAIHGAFTVDEMLRHWCALHDAAALYDAAIHFFDLERFLYFKTSNLSAGWRQKLALCRLIVQPAGLWLLDEPASHLDEHSVGLLQSLISSRKEQGGLVLIAMHGNAESGDIKIINLDY